MIGNRSQMPWETLAELQRYFGKFPTFMDSTLSGKCTIATRWIFSYWWEPFIDENTVRQLTCLYAGFSWGSGLRQSKINIWCEDRCNNYWNIVTICLCSREPPRIQPAARKTWSIWSSRPIRFASKLRHFVWTPGSQLSALRSGNMNLGLDRIVSHTDKNYLCNIRSICHGVNRAVTVIRPSIISPNCANSGRTSNGTQKIMIGGASFCGGKTSIQL
jgi:hypothetical protein